MKAYSRVQLDLVVLKKDGSKALTRTVISIPAKDMKRINAINDVETQYEAIRDYVNSEYEVDCLEVRNAMCIDTLL